MKYMPTNPITDAVSCVSRGGDCRHAAPPFGLQGRPAIILRRSTSPLLPRCLFQCVACRWGSRLLVKRPTLPPNRARQTLSVLSAARARSFNTLRNVVAHYPFEKSRRFAAIQPNFGHRDHSRLSCSTGDTQLGAGFCRIFSKRSARTLAIIWCRREGTKLAAISFDQKIIRFLGPQGTLVPDR